jgi:4-amino-4-deoxy-L-arabinose transferase-like glycosyltransferase
LNASGKRIDVGLTAVVFTVTLAATLVFLHSYPVPTPKNDAALYYRIARNVAAGKGFSLDGTHPYTGVPPVFSTLLGMWFRSAGDSVIVATVFQSLVHAFAAAASFLLFRAMPCGPRLSFVLALVVALQPILLTRVAFILMEPTLLLFTTSALLATVTWLRGQTVRWGCASGFLWGIAALAKPVTLFVLPLAFVYRMACGREGIRAALRQAVFFSLLFLAVLAPWTARNYVRFQRLIPVSDQVGGALWEWHASRATPEGAIAERAYAAERDREGDSWDRRIEAFLRKSKARLGNFPVDQVARNAIDFASPARDWWWERGRYGPGDAREWYWAVHDVFHRFLFLVLLYLVFRTVRGKLPAPRGFVALFCFLYWIEYSLLLGIPRYGIPIYPALLALLIPGSWKQSPPSSGDDDAGQPGEERP